MSLTSHRAYGISGFCAPSYKTDEVIKKGYILFHVWEDDWITKEDLIKSMLSNKLKNNTNRIYARKTYIKSIDSKTARIFLDENHIQGYSSASIYLGLYYREELVSLMSFSKPRVFMSQKSEINHYELNRFCNKKYTSVIGGASKLFKYFLNNYKVSQIYSFSDRSYSNGNLYKELGFIYNSQSKVNYNWVINKERKHRYNFRKDKLVSMGYDKNKSEKEIMYEDVGSYRIWNSGQDKWIYKV